MFNKWGIPKIEKIYEAFSAIADNRIELLEKEAYVTSSDSKKKYTITWEGNTYSSNDNSSYYQGNLGYPVIAVLMLQGKLNYTKEIVNCFQNINWKALNTKHKRKYDLAVLEVLTELQAQNKDIEAIKKEVTAIYETIPKLDILYQRSKILPPN